MVIRVLEHDIDAIGVVCGVGEVESRYKHFHKVLWTSSLLDITTINANCLEPDGLADWSDRGVDGTGLKKF
jgi:hypothetical protein